MIHVDPQLSSHCRFDSHSNNDTPVAVQYVCNADVKRHTVDYILYDYTVALTGIANIVIQKMASPDNNKPANGASTSASRRRANAPSDGEQELIVSLAGGLLGSSCCLIQLALNLLSEFGVMQPIGCAGFNTFLGPLRLYLRVLTILYFSYKWIYDKTCCSKRKLVFYTVLCASLMFMPEALRVLSRNSSFSRLGAIAPSTTNTERLVYTVDNMGCEACETHVKHIVESFDGVVSVESVDFETGLLHLSVNRDWQFDENRLDAKLEANGYDLLPEGSATKRMTWEGETVSDGTFDGSDL